MLGADGATGGDRVTDDDDGDSAPTPIALIPATENEYVSPVTRPLATQLVVVLVAEL